MTLLQMIRLIAEGSKDKQDFLNKLNSLEIMKQEDKAE